MSPCPEVCGTELMGPCGSAPRWFPQIGRMASFGASCMDRAGAEPISVGARMAMLLLACLNFKCCDTKPCYGMLELGWHGRAD
jgi:hypothetical protein